MRIALVHFQSLLPEDGRISLGSELLSERNASSSDLNAPQRSNDRLAIEASLKNTTGDPKEDLNRDLLRTYQLASNDLLEQVLDHAHQRGSNFVVVRGLALSTEALNTIARFSIDATIVALSPADATIMTTVSQKYPSLGDVDAHATINTPTWLAWVEGPYQRTAHLLRNAKPIVIHAEATSIAIRNFVDVRYGESFELTLGSLGRAVTTYGSFGVRAQIRTLGENETIDSDRQYQDSVQRIVHVDLAVAIETERAVDEVIIVPKGLDPALDVAAEEIAGGAVNVGTAERLRQLRSLESAPPSVVALAAELLAHTNRSATDGQPPVLILRQEIFSAEECLYRHLKQLRDRLEESTLDRHGLLAVNARCRALAPLVYPTLLDAQDLPESTDSDYEWAFYASLGPYDGQKARSSLSRQLEVLRFLADLDDPGLELVYRAATEIDPLTDSPGSVFEIIVRYLRTTDDSLRAKRRRNARSIGLMLHSVFTDVYAMSFGEQRPVHPRSHWPQEKRTGELTFYPADGLQKLPDWALFFRLAHEVGSEVGFEITVAATPRDAMTSRPIEDGSVLEEFHRTGSDSGRGLSMRAKLTAGVEQLNLLASVVCNQFSLSQEDRATTVLRPASVVTRFHPPFDELPAYGRRLPLRLPIQGAAFPAAGVELGGVKIRRTTTDQTEAARLADRDRLRHIYVLGRTGTGKTNFLKHLVGQDVRRDGQGVTVIDPHGELVDHALTQIPWTRIDNGEVVWLDFSRRDYLPVLNPFYRGMESAERDRTIQTVLKLLRERVYHEWTGPRFEEMIRICLVTMLHDKFPGIPNIIQVPRLLSDHDYRKKVVNNLNDPGVTARWRFHDSQRGDRDFASTLDWAVSKFTDLLEDETLRLTLSGDVRTVDFERILTDGQILLVKLPEGVVGPDAAEFLGALIVAQLRLAAFRVGGECLAGRGRSHFVYLDEFQKFTTTDIARVVAEARKFGLGMVLAHQNLEQLREFSRYAGRADDSLQATILGNVGNTVIFKTGTVDSQRMEQHLSLSGGSIAKLGRFEAVASVLVDGRDVGPFTLSPPLVRSSANPRNMHRIVEVMSKPDGVWRRFEDLLAQASPAAAGSTPSGPAEPSAGRPSAGSGSFLDEWLAKRRRPQSPPQLRTFVPRIGTDRDTSLPDYADAIDAWLAQRRSNTNTPPSSETPGQPGVMH